MTPTAPMQVLDEVRALMARKANDYQNPNSTVKHAHHYRRGVATIFDMLHQKMLRAQSLIESETIPNCEALEDTFKDIVAYASFAVCCIRGTLDGQDPNRDMFNLPLIHMPTPKVQPWTGTADDPTYVATFNTVYDDLPSDVEPTSDTLVTATVDSISKPSTGFFGTAASTMDEDVAAVAAYVDTLKIRESNDLIGAAVERAKRNVADVADVAAYVDTLKIRESNDLIGAMWRRASALDPVHAGASYTRGDGEVDFYRTDILANDAANARLKEAAEVTRHAKARGLPKEMAKTPFPPEGHPVYSSVQPMYTEFDR